MKKSLLIIGLSLLTAFSASAYAFSAKNSSGTTIYYSINSDGASVRVMSNGGYDSYAGSVDVPSSVTYNSKSYTVTEIGEDAFYSCDNLTEVTLPSTLTTISSWAFNSCPNLNNVTIPNSVTTIDEGAFGYCSSFTSISLPNSVTYIGPSAFSGCENLEKVTFYCRITEISDNMFAGCEKLTQAFLPSSVTSIGKEAFMGCSALTKFKIPRYVTSIGSWAFAWCSSMEQLTVYVNPTDCTVNSDAFYEFPVTTCKLYVNEGMKSDFLSQAVWSQFSDIGVYLNYDFKKEIDGVEYAFFFNYGDEDVCLSYLVRGIEGGGSSYTGTTVKIPSSVNYGNKEYPVTQIGQWAFENAKIESVVIPNTITTINRYAFSGCKNLTKVYLPESVKNLRGGSFEYCDALTEVSLPSSLSYMHHGAFRYNPNISKIEVRVANPNDIEHDSYVSNYFGGVNFNTCKLYVPAGSTSLYANHDFWKSFKNIYALPHYDFIAQNEGASIYYTFENAKNVTVTYKDTNYGSYSGSVVIPAQVSYEGSTYDVTGISDNAFNKCNSMASLTLPSGITFIGDNAFTYCSKLTDFTMPNAVTSLGDNAFSYCTKLKNVNLSSSLGVVGAEAFSYCSAIEDITIPESVYNLGDRAFSYCTGLKAIREMSVSPVDVLLGANVFLEVPKSNCVVYVPFGSAYMYEQAPQWNDFTIMECTSLGDVNCDGKINSADITFIVLHLLGNTPEGFNESAADVNQDGLINSADITAIILINLGSN